MKATYVQQGAALDYMATEAVPNGAVVSLETRIGIAAGDIPAGSSGTVHVEGVYRLARTWPWARRSTMTRRRMP